MAGAKSNAFLESQMFGMDGGAADEIRTPARSLRVIHPPPTRRGASQRAMAIAAKLKIGAASVYRIPNAA
jgi:hypothetical protein